jgi:2-amino-4-hydroxy-6-hydroxymethyldihydropteridine diphosphokinase
VKTAYLSIGSNVGDRQANIERAIELLESPDIHVRRRAPLYATEPRDFAAQPWFLNTAVEIETTLFPRQLLSRIQKIERDLGRRRHIEKGPRTIDIDIVLFGSFVVSAADLIIPHPRFPERRFVLAPLADLAPDLRHPETRETVREMLEKTLDQSVRRLEYYKS